MGKRKKRKKPSHYKQRNASDTLHVSPDLHIHDAHDDQDNPKSRDKDRKEHGPMIELVKKWWLHLQDAANSNRLVAVFTIIIAVTGVLYAGFAALQWSELSRTNDLSRDQFEESERPYLWQVSAIEKNSSNMHFELGTKIPNTLIPNGLDYKCTIQVENYGHSPAIVTQMSGDVRVGKEKTATIRQLTAQRWESKNIILPQGRVDNFSTQRDIYGGPPMSLDFIAVVFLRIQYKNLAGHLFESDMCISTPVSYPSEVEYCPAEFGLNRLIDCKKEKCEQ